MRRAPLLPLALSYWIAPNSRKSFDNQREADLRNAVSLSVSARKEWRVIAFRRAIFNILLQ